MTAREAHTCIGKLDVDSLDSYNLEEAQQKAVRRDAIVTLTPEESHLFQTLENAAIAYETKMAPFDQLRNLDDDDCEDGGKSNDNYNHQESSSSSPRPIEIRIAGGWVRDKLMNQSSHDVDIALDSLSGRQFAFIVQHYLMHQRSGIHKEKNPHGKKPKVAVIAANPSQSKHLETATMRIDNIDCDFVHLRGGEVYSQDSRIPTLKETATPLDDALRRDFTVNSLFYNLRKKYVEDWTGRGISDLIQDRVLVTPLDARITFHDDPLRVLRAVRFAVRYNLDLCPEIQLAAMSPTVHESLHVKVSRERVGKELEGMLTGKNARPCVALKMITDLKLAGCVFEFPPPHSCWVVKGDLQGVAYGDCAVSQEKQKCAREKSWEEATEMLQHCSLVLSSFEQFACTKNNNNHGEWDGSSTNATATTVDHRLFYLCTFLHPLRNMVCVDSKGKEMSLPAYIVRDSIKFPNRDVTAISTVLKYVDEMRSILQSYGGQTNHQGGNDATIICRLKSGLLLRSLKEHWVTALLVASVAEIQSMGLTSSCLESDNKDELQASMIAEKAFRFYQDIQTHNLDHCWKIRPLLDGKAILESLGLPRGPMVGNYLEEQMKWMLLNPKGTRHECETHLREMRKRDLEVAASSLASGSSGSVHPNGGNEKSITENDGKVETTMQQHGKTKRLHLE